MAAERKYSIGELTELTGISRRSVHYYVQRGLVPSPLGAGRGHYYTEDHVTRIKAIKDLQAYGLSLEEIEERFRMPMTLSNDNYSAKAEKSYRQEPTVSDEDDGSPTLMTRVRIAEGVELTVESGHFRLSPGRLRRLRKAVREILGSGFQQPVSTDDKEEE